MGKIAAGDTVAFQRDGFVIKRGFYNPAQMSALTNAFQVDQSIRTRKFGVDDRQGGATEDPVRSGRRPHVIGTTVDGDR